MLHAEKSLKCECGGTPYAEWYGDTLNLQCPLCHRGIVVVKKRSEDMEDLVNRIVEGTVFSMISRGNKDILAGTLP
ncbi:hypothetical protein AKJ51_04740 [candidate division MSBL1 archaeon SCGC-AAA382A20]|uniref:Uncharacterized protein n=1 Tax=candidate division MSBL1 archaeon SCGC-AAA382A20 TaxID=1698280 RepID=A0A133VHB6_9EURY|nr:hypothetical protein AKJ51_04740 [candidate division MSBL1 archaeon SCGC-AAA382A20]